METADASSARRGRITQAITAELERQAHDGAARIDVDAMAQAIEAAIDPSPQPSEGKRPEDLNATNDD